MKYNISELVLKANGFDKFNPMQAAVLKEGFEKNIVVSAPTASGKTVVAELFALESVLNEGKKVIYTCPLRALASEHYSDFKKKYSIQGSLTKIKFAVSTGDLDSNSSYLKNFDVIMTTYEKLASLLRHKSEWLSDVGCIIIDELHELDSDRGPVLEIALTQLRTNNPKIKILGLSATIPNAKELADWLDAKLVLSDYRPTKLREGVLSGSETQFNDGSKENGELEELINENLSNNKQLLFFMNSRKKAEQLARKLSEQTKKFVEKDVEQLEKISESILNVLESPTEQCSSLAGSIKLGSAFHHAGLVNEQREIVEDNFRKGKIKILCATPTLCLHPDTELWQGNTQTKVSEFSKLNNRLIALKGNDSLSVRPQAVIKNYNTCKMITLTSSAGHTITLTENHQVLVKRGGKKILIEARNCKKRDIIATVGKLWTPRPTNYNIGYFTINNPFSEMPLNENITYFIGAMLGDGCSGMDRENGKLLFKDAPSIVGRDNEIFLHVQKMCKAFNLHYREGKNSYGVPTLTLSKRKWFRLFLANSGVLIGQKKYVCDELKRCKKKEVTALLRGLFDTDGCVEARGRVSFSNSSTHLIKDVQRLLLDFGIVSLIVPKKGRAIHITEKEYHSKDYFELVIANNTSLLKFADEIGFGIQRKQDALNRIRSKIISNTHYVQCKKCGYSLCADLFSGRTKEQKVWGQQKQKVINFLGKNNQATSFELEKVLGFKPYKGEKRLDHHFELIERVRIGNSKLWRLNKIGQQVYLLMQKNEGNLFTAKLESCPICKSLLNTKTKCEWREGYFEGDIFWDYVRKISTNSSSSCPVVYDVVLPNNGSTDHLFVANGFFVHNSAGVNTPADVVIIPTLYRFDKYGMNLISVREYKQMAGRSGRPKFSSEGKSIVVSNDENQRDMIMEKFVNGKIEVIESKLSIIPILRTHVLALIATDYIYDIKSIEKFFEKTLYAHQLQSMGELLDNVIEIIDDLIEYKFVDKKEDKYKATLLGKRVSDLFLDPDSANELITALCAKKTFTSFSYLYAWVNCTEFSPWIRPPKNTHPILMEEMSSRMELLPFSQEKILFEPESLEKFFSAMMLELWINEKKEQDLFKEYDLAPGLLFGKNQIIEWLSYSTIELAKALGQDRHLVAAQKLGKRVKYGVKEELLSLVELKGIGRARARKLFMAGIKKPSEVKASMDKVEALLGKKVSTELAKQFSSTKSSNSDFQSALN
ncbi:MAG: DEAD/DEAH box helicase [archaeon]|jgi:helicase